MLLGELDLLHLLRSGRAGIKQSESQKRQKQRTQKSPTISNGDMPWSSVSIRACTHNFGRGMTAIARTTISIVRWL
jgi:hypothetical protein